MKQHEHLPYGFGRSDTSPQKAPQKVRDYLKEHGKIDKQKIIELTGTKNAAGIIKLLRDKHGMTIQTKRKYIHKTWWEISS